LRLRAAAIGRPDQLEEGSLRKWLRRLRGAIGPGLTWAAAWALLGLLIGVASTLLPGLPWDAFFGIFDAPLPALAVPGFVGGAIFSVVVGIAARHRRFEELSVARFAAWGALGGLLLSLVPAVLAAAHLATLRPDLVPWGLTATICAPLTVLGALSAAGSLALARMAGTRHSLGAGADVEALRGEREAPEPGARDAAHPTAHRGGESS
jgi:hypothetical protein